MKQALEVQYEGRRIKKIRFCKHERTIARKNAWENVNNEQIKK